MTDELSISIEKKKHICIIIICPQSKTISSPCIATILDLVDYISISEKLFIHVLNLMTF